VNGFGVVMPCVSMAIYALMGIYALKGIVCAV
jgi:hypothetical protein